MKQNRFVWDVTTALVNSFNDLFLLANCLFGSLCIGWVNKHNRLFILLLCLHMLSIRYVLSQYTLWQILYNSVNKCYLYLDPFLQYLTQCICWSNIVVMGQHRANICWRSCTVFVTEYTEIIRNVYSVPNLVEIGQLIRRHNSKITSGLFFFVSPGTKQIAVISWHSLMSVTLIC